jgi:hypothetical protein
MHSYTYVEALKREAQLRDVLDCAYDKLGDTERETLSFIFEDDHFHMLLESLKEAKEGKVVSFKNAFSDLD